MQERTHAFAMKSQMWLLDPRPDLPAIVRMVEQGFELSEASNTPVMLMMRIRACHMHGRFVASDNRRPAFTVADALAAPRRSYDRIILPPSTYSQEREKIDKRWPAAVEFVARHALNERHDGDLQDIGIVLQGGLYNTLLRALERLGLADVFGASQRTAVRSQRHLPAGTGRARGVRRGQACAARRRGRPAGVPRAVDRPAAAPGGACDRGDRQGTVPARGRVHRGRHAPGPRSLRRALPAGGASAGAHARGQFAATRTGATAAAGGGARRGGARAPLGSLHRLSRAPALHGDEADRARARSHARQRRHRLPLLCDAPAVRSRRQHHGLRARRRGRGGARERLDRRAGRWR